MLKLVVRADSVECVRSEILAADSGIPFHVYLVATIISLIKSFALFKVSVKSSGFVSAETVATSIASRYLIAESTVDNACMASAIEITVRTTFSVYCRSTLLISAGYDVDSSHKRRRAINSSGRSFKDFNTFNFGYVYWEFGCIMAGLRVANVDSI